MKLNVLHLRDSIVVKLFIVLFIVIILFYAISLYMVNRANISLENEVIQTNIAKTELFTKSLELEFLNQEKVQYQFVNNYQLEKLSIGGHAMSDYEKVENISSLQDEILKMIALSKYVNDIIIYIPNVSRSISLFPILDVLDDQLYSDLLKKSIDYNLLYEVDDALHFTFLYPILNYEENKNRPLFIIDLFIPKKNIISEMNEYFSNSDEKVAIIQADMNWNISTDEEIPDFINNYIIDNKTMLINNEISSNKIKLDDDEFWISCKYSSSIDSFIISYRSVDTIAGIKSPTNLLTLFLSLFSLIIIIMFIYFINLLIARPINDLIVALKKVEKGNLDFEIEHNPNSEFKYVYNQFNKMVYRLKHLIEQNYEHQLRTRDAELKQLQMQIKPHFLYNNIFIIYRMAVDKDFESIQKLSKALGSYYRFITRINSDFIPIKREFDHVRDYISIQNMRFGNRITATLDPLPEEYNDIQVPPIVLQPIVENAYGHGVKSMESDGIISITFNMHNEFLDIITDDNGEGLSNEMIKNLNASFENNALTHTTTGLSNVHRRVRIKHGEQSGLLLEKSPLGGLRVIIRIAIYDK